MKYHLGLGSNLGDRAGNLARARSRLVKKRITIVAASTLVETEPVGLTEQPWFINQVVEVRSNLAPREMLEAIKGIEKIMKRRPTVRNGPRIIDIDILLAEDTVVRTEDLTVPHPRLAERNFVLVPLAEIDPEAVHPVLKRTIRDLLRRSKDCSRVEMIR